MQKRAATGSPGSEGSKGSKGSEGKVDGPSGRGLWPPDGGGLCSLALKGATAPSALRVVVSPYRAMSIKSALRDWLSVSYGMIRILVVSRCAAPPYPAAPDFLHGKACHTILRSLCSLTNRVPLPPHPGDRIKHSMLSCRDMAPLLSTHSPTTKWGEGGGASHQRGPLEWYKKSMTQESPAPHLVAP